MNKIENFTKEEMASFVTNPCWKDIKDHLKAAQAEMYAVMMDENTRLATVKSKADKISIIDDILLKENEIIKKIQGN